MSMYVTYKCYKNNRLVLSRENTGCFSALNYYNNIDFDTIEVKIKWSNKTKAYINYWLNLVQEIESKAKLIKKNDGKWMSFPYNRERHGKMIIILTILRYLWEDTNRYDDIVIMTKRITDKYPEMDKLKAVLIANSATANCAGWGHSVVKGMALKLKTTWHYKRYKDHLAHNLAGKSYGSEPIELRNIIRKAKKDRYDVEPALKHYGIV